jgi:hypothetical protein
MFGHLYQVCAPSVVSEVIEGEAIIMDMRNGAYYSVDGFGAQVWQAVAGGVAHQDILDWTRRSYPGETGAADAVDAFIEALLARNLIMVRPGPAAPAPETASGPFEAPLLSVHDDMQDLIMMDPIHDVNEMGWPTRKAEATAS